MSEIKREKRAIAEPPTSNVVYGPREGFIEDIDVSMGLIFARIKKEKLDIVNLEVGDITSTKVVVLSAKGIADKNLVSKIVNKIKDIKIDGVLDSYYISSYLQERPESIFKQVGITEKPDILVGKLLEGRVAVLVDGSPIVLTLPFILLEDLQSADDYYDEKTKVSLMRLLRLFGAGLALVLPAVYVAFLLFHTKAIPIKLLVTILNSSAMLPFPPAVEMLFIIFLFEVLYEASVRIPKGLGSSFNIVGALILGTTVVASNLASPITVMIVSVSSISLYLIPEQTSVFRLLRLVFLAGSIVFGGLGVVCIAVFVVAYLADFDAYGAAYLAPFAPYIKQDQKDAVFKEHLTKLDDGKPKSLGRLRK